VQQALETISKEKKLDAVMANSNMQKAVIIGGVDITDDLIQKLK
jgi:Skp family chaperone for outer membrane proteins